MLSRRDAAAFIVLCAAFLATAYVVPRGIVYAEGTAADKMCPAEEKNKKEYNPSKPWNKPWTETRDGKQVTIQNLFGKPCWDETNKAKTIGHCLRKDRCLADKTAEGDKPQQADCNGINKGSPGCAAGAGQSKDGGGSPPGLPSPPGSGGDGKPPTPQPEKTPEQKRLEESFKALDPKPDLKPGEKAVPVDQVNEDEFLKLCSTCKPLSEIGKSSSLYDQAFNTTPLDQQKGGLKTAETQSNDVFNSDLYDPSNISKLDDGLGKNEFQQQTDGRTEQGRLDTANTFTPANLGTVQERESARVTTPGNPTLDVTTHGDSGLVTKLAAKDNVSDEQWGQMVTQAQKEMSQNCPSGYSCIMVNNESTREMTVHYSKASPGMLPEGASVLTPNQDKLGTAGGFVSTLTGSGPTSAGVAEMLRKEGATVTMPDGREVRVAFNEASAKAIAPSIANSYDPEQSSVWGRLSSATGFNSDRVADGDFMARDPNKPIAVETQTVTPSEPTRITVTPRDTAVPAEIVNSQDAPQAETRQPVRVPIYADAPAPAPSSKPEDPAETPVVRPPQTPSAPPSETQTRPPSQQPPSQQPVTPSQEAPSQSAPSRTNPQQQSSADANLIDRVYCWIFTCQSPQQQAPQSAPPTPSAPPPQTPPQQMPSQNPPVAQRPPQTTPPAQTPPSQQPANTNPTQSPTASNPPTPTPTQTTPPTSAPHTTQPQQTPSPAPSRTAPSRIATNNGVSNVSPPDWTQSQPTVGAAAPSAAAQRAAPGTAPAGEAAPSNSRDAKTASAAPRATNPIALNNAAARLTAQATAQAAARQSAPTTGRTVPGDKVAVLATDKAVDPKNTVPLQAATQKPDVVLNNPKAGGTAGEPEVTKPDTTPRKAEIAVRQGDAGKISNKPTAPTTPNPEVKRPTVGPNPTGKIGTSGSGDGNGTGVGEGNGSEAGVQGPSSCGLKCLAQKVINGLGTLSGISPAQAAPTPAMSPAEARRQIDVKLAEIKQQITASEQLGKTEAALEPLKRALNLGREIAEIANRVNDPGIKAIAGEVNQKVLNVQRLTNAYDKSHYLDGSSSRIGAIMEKEFPKTIPAAWESVKKLNTALTELANKPPAQAPTDTPLTGAPQPASRPANQPVPNTTPGTPGPIAKKIDQPVGSQVAPGKRAHVYANITNPATAKVVYGMYGIGGSIEDTMNPSKNNIGQQFRSSKFNGVLVVPDTGTAPGQAGGGTAGALKSPDGANAFDQEMNTAIAAATGLPRDTVAKMDREVVFHSGGFDPGKAMVQALGKKVVGVQALDGMYGDAAKTLAEWKKNNPDGTLTSLCASTCAENQKLADALRAAGVAVNTTPVTTPKGATVAPAGDSHFGVMTNNDPVKQFLASTGDSAPLAGQPQPAARTPANQPVLPRVQGNINSQSDRAAVAQQAYQIVQQQGIKPSDLTRGSPNYGQAWKSVVEATRLALDARSMLHPQLDLPAVLAVARQETGIPGNRNEFTSTTGVRGYMQVTGNTAQSILGNRMFQTFHGPWDVRSFAREDNIGSVITGSMLMNQNLHACGGNLSCAGQTYNSGSPNSCSGQGCVNGVPTYGPAVARDTQVMRQAVQNAGNNPSAIADYLRNLASNRARSNDALQAYTSILTGAELGPLTPIKCAYQGCAATPTIEPGNRGYSPNVNRVAQAPTSGLYYSDPQTGAIGVPADPNMTREQFIRAAREDVAMERLAQNSRLPQGSAFQNFKATANGSAPRPMAPREAAQAVLGKLNAAFGCTGRACLADDQVYQYGGANADIPAQYADLMKSRLALGGASNPNGAASASILKAFIGAIEMNPEDSKGIVINSAERDLSHVGSDRHNSSGHHESTRAFDLQGFKDRGQQARFLARMAAIIQADGLTPNIGLGGNTTHIDTNGSEVAGGGLAWCYNGCAGVTGDLASLKNYIQNGQQIPDSYLDRVVGQQTVGAQPTYDIANGNGETVARNVPLPDGTVGQNGDVRLLSNKDGLPMNAGGVPIKDGESPLKISSDRTLPTATEDRDGLAFKDERPTQPRADDPWKRGRFANPYPQSDPYTSPRPTSYCLDNNGRVYGCTPTGGSNPTGGTQPGGGGPGGGGGTPTQGAQQYPKQYPVQTPYPFPPLPTLPPPVIDPPLTPSISCSPSSVPFGTSSPVTVQWSCLTGSASSTGFAAGSPIGRTTVTSNRAATTTLRFLLQCISGVRVSPTVSCSVPVVTPPAPLVSLSVDPNPVNSGGSAIVIWGSSNATSCSLHATSTTNLIDGSVNGSTSTAPLYMATPITLTCRNAAGITASTTIQIRVNDESASSS